MEDDRPKLPWEAWFVALLMLAGSAVNVLRPAPDIPRSKIPLGSLTGAFLANAPTGVSDFFTFFPLNVTLDPRFIYGWTALGALCCLGLLQRSSLAYGILRWQMKINVAALLACIVNACVVLGWRPSSPWLLIWYASAAPPVLYLFLLGRSAVRDQYS